MYLQEWVNQSRAALAKCIDGSGYNIEDFVTNIQEDIGPFSQGVYRVRILYKPTDTVKFFKIQPDQDDDLLFIFRKTLDELTDMVKQMKKTSEENV